MEYRILEMLKRYSRSHSLRMHMPGHKRAASFRRAFPLAKYDITELPFSDSLISPSPNGVVYKAQEDVAIILNAAKSFILTDGATSGVHAMLYAFCKRGDKVIINRTAHKSVYDVCALINVEPIALTGNIRDGVMLPPSAQKIDEALRSDKKIKAVLLTSPDYFGNICDYRSIKAVTEKRGVPLLIDGAHGAHLAFDKETDYAGEYADVWVDGAHKTLATLTQGAILSTSREEFVNRLELALSVFRTSSPSYPIMASVEYGVKYAYQHGTARIDGLKRELSLLTTRLKKRGLSFYPSADRLKLCVDFSSVGINARLAAVELQRRKVFCELCNDRYALFYLSLMDGAISLFRLERALRHTIKQKNLKSTAKTDLIDFYTILPQRVCGYLNAINAKSEFVPLSKAVGRVAAVSVGVFPPSTPIVLAGELFDKTAVDYLRAQECVFNVSDNLVSVLCEQQN